jgi:hypothetical protein
LQVPVATGTRRRDTHHSRDTLPSKDTHLRDTPRSMATRLHLAVTLRSSTVTHRSRVTLHSSMATLSKVATPLQVTLAHLVMVVAMDLAWVACSLEAQQLRQWLMEHTRFLAVTVGTWEVDTWEEA